MALDNSNDIEVGVSVNVAPNNAAAQTEAELRKIEAASSASREREINAQKTANFRAETEAKRHAAEMQRIAGDAQKSQMQQAAVPTYMQSRPTFMPASMDEMRGARIAGIASRNDLNAAKQLKTEQDMARASEITAAKIGEIRATGAERRASISLKFDQDTANSAALTEAKLGDIRATGEERRASSRAIADKRLENLTKSEDDRATLAKQKLSDSAAESAVRRNSAMAVADQRVQNLQRADIDRAAFASQKLKDQEAEAALKRSNMSVVHDQRLQNLKNADLERSTHAAQKLADTAAEGAIKRGNLVAIADQRVATETQRTEAVRLESANRIANSTSRTTASVAVLTARAENEVQRGENLRAAASIRMAQAAGGAYVYNPLTGTRVAPASAGGPASTVVAPVVGGSVVAPTGGTSARPAGFFSAATPAVPPTGGTPPPVPAAGGTWTWVPGRGGPGGGGGGAGGGSNFSADAFQSAGTALGQTLSTLQNWFIRLAEIGVRGLITELTLAVGILVKLSQSFLKVNEEFSTFELTLASVFKSSIDAEKVRRELATSTATSPVPFQGLAELTKMISVNPALRGSMINQVQNGDLSDQKGFLQKNIHLLEQMLAYKPDKNADDAVFALREATTGRFTSMARRFSMPESMISSISGTSRADLQSDPKKALEAIQKTFQSIIDPQAIKDMARQPSHLFQNLMEQIFIIPLLSLGHDTRVTQTGRSLYDSVMLPFQRLMKTSVEFFSPNLSTALGRGSGDTPGVSKFQDYAQQMAGPIFSIFEKVFNFMGESVGKILGKFGISFNDNPSLSLWERIANVALVSIQALEKNIEPLMTKIRDVIFNFFTIFQKIVNMVASLVNEYGGFIAEHPAASIAIAAGAVPAIKMTGSLISSGVGALAANSTAGMAAGAAGGSAAGAGIAAAGASVVAFITPLLPAILAIVLAGAVIAAIVAAVKSQDTSNTPEVKAADSFIKNLKEEVQQGIPGGDSPEERKRQFLEVRQAQVDYRSAQFNHPGETTDSPFGAIGNKFHWGGTYEPSPEEASAKERMDKLQKEFARKSKISVDDKIFSMSLTAPGADENSPEVESPGLKRLLEGFQEAQNQTKSKQVIGLTNTNRLQRDLLPGEEEYNRSPQSERDHPAFAAIDRFKAAVLGASGNDTSAKLAESEDKMRKKLNPLYELVQDGQRVIEARKELTDALGKLNAGTVDVDVKEDLQRAENHLREFKAHGEGIKSDARFASVTGEEGTYEEVLAFDQQRVEALKAMIGQGSLDGFKRAQEALELFKNGMIKKREELATLSAHALEASKENVLNSPGTPEQANEKLDELAKTLKLFGAIPEEKIDAEIAALRSVVTFAKTGNANIDLRNKQTALTAYGKLADGIIEDLQKFMDGLSTEIKAQMLSRGFGLANLSLMPTEAPFAISTTTTTRQPTLYNAPSDRANPMEFNVKPSPFNQPPPTPAPYGAGGTFSGVPLDPRSIGPNGAALPSYSDPTISAAPVGLPPGVPTLDEFIAKFNAEHPTPMSGATTPEQVASSTAVTRGIVEEIYKSQFKEQIDSFRTQNAPIPGTDVPPIPGTNVDVTPRPRAEIPNAVRDFKQTTGNENAQVTTEQQLVALTDQNRQIDSGLASLTNLLGNAGNTGRGSAEGREGLRQFNSDIEALTKRFPELMDGLNVPIDSLFQNVKKFGASGLDVTLEKLATARDISIKLAERLEAASQKLVAANTPESLAQAQKYRQTAGTLRMQAAKDQDQITAQQLSGNPITSFAEGFAAKSKQPANYFTDLRNIGVQVAGEISTAFSNAFVGFANGTLTAAQAFQQFGKSVLDTIAKIASQRAAEAILNLIVTVGGAALGAGAGAAGSWTSTPASGVGSGIFGGTGTYAEGGAIYGPGTGTSDSVPAWLSHGEHVWTAEEVRKAGGHHVMNQMRENVRGYADGGFVSSGNGPTVGGSNGSAGSPGTSGGGDSFNINISTNAGGGGGSNLSPAQQRERQRVMADGLQNAVQAEIRRQQRVTGALHSTRFGN